ncbi:MAG TPA: glycine cleavage system protein GcvH [bacterium]|nr:glycine cleavage system protein GcvH [bacterium]
MEIPKVLKYVKTHEWIRIEKEMGTVGITDYAQKQLTDVVFVELPQIGKVVSKGEAVAVLESVKSVSDIYAPVSGEITEVNKELENKPGLINEEPYGKGWIFKLKIKDPKELDSLLSAGEYEKSVTGDR